jgi:ketosteroid isomerase-like protein
MKPFSMDAGLTGIARGIRDAQWRRCFVAVSGLLAVVFSASLTLSADMDANAKALAKLDDDWSKAAATKDAERVASFYADDAIAYPPNEPAAVGKAAAKKVWAAYFADPTFAISWKTTHAEVTGGLGFTAGTYEDSFKGPDGQTVREKGKYVCVWRKQKGGTWKAIHDIWNADSK